MHGQTISHYRILKKLGAGGMGVVYVAEDVLLGRRVAIKMLTTDASPGKQHYRTRFLREARAVSALSHSHIATVFDYGETQDGQPFIVMELVKGQTLSELLREKSLTIARAVEIVAQIAQALAEAHQHGIVHRDIKPSNVALNERGEVKVLDFGLAKQVDGGAEGHADPELALLDTQTREGLVIGTPMYLSPEQAMGLPVDQRSDLFSLGALLYECVAGRPPFSGLSPAAICAQVIRDNPPPPSSLNPDVLPELDRITLKALAKKVDERYESADDLVADLSRLQTALRGSSAGEAVARRTQPPRRAARTSALSTLSDIFYRPRLPVGVLLLGLLGASLLAGVLWLIIRPAPHQPPREAQRLFDLGTNALREGTYYKASKVLQLAVAADDRFALAHARLAEAWMELDYTDKAKDELLIVTNRLAPDRSALPRLEALYLDAIAATVTRDTEKAVGAYSEITKLKPDDPQAHIDLARAYEKSDDAERAVEIYAKAASLDRGDAVALLRLGILHGRRRDTANALAAFAKAETLYQDSSNFEGTAEVLYQRAYLYSQAGKLDEADSQLRKAWDITRINNNTYQQVRILLEMSRVAYSKGDTARARELATEAVDLAKANGMENLTTQGLHDLGYAFLVRRAYADAEQYFRQALDFAQRYKGRNNEARVMLSLGNLYIQQENPDEGLPYIEHALSYYRAGGYRKEVARCLTMLGRANLLKGDYEGALKVFEEQLELARQVEDRAQVASSEAEIGSALARQEVYPAALRHFDQSYEINSSLGNPLNAGFALLNKADMLARLGRNEDARASLDQLQPLLDSLSGDNNNKQVWTAWAHLIRARMAFGERNFAEARAECLRALETAARQNKNTVAAAKATLGAVETSAGRRSEGRRLCEEAVSIAGETDDLRLQSDVRLILAEALLEGGDWRGAAAAALQSLEGFGHLHKQESAWRAWLTAARAASLAGDEAASRERRARASATLSALRQLWGEEGFGAYAARPDIKLYLQHLDEQSAPAGRAALR